MTRFGIVDISLLALGLALPFALALGGCAAFIDGDALRENVGAGLTLDGERLDYDDAPRHKTAELDAFLDACGSGGDDCMPPLPSLPEQRSMPKLCDEATRIEAVIGACGPLTEASGASLAQQAASCPAGTTCHIVLGAGDFDGGVELGCAVVEGAGDATRIHGALGFHAPSVLARVRVDDDYGAVGTSADLLVNEAALVGGYEGLGFAWDADIDVAVCRSRVAAGYGGVGQSWGSRRLTVAGSAVSAGYEAVATSWGSSGLHVEHNVLFAGYVGVHIHNSLTSAVIASSIYGDYEAVSVFSFEDDPTFEYDPTSAGAVISGNVIIGGSLPASDAAHDILVENNSQL